MPPGRTSVLGCPGSLRDNGAPGFRDQGYRKNANYVAFVLDPDNNNIEASWPNPSAAS